MPPGARRSELERVIDKRFRRRWGARDPALVKRLLGEARRAFKIKPFSMTASYAILVAPPYPAEPELEVHPVGILARVERGKFSSLLGITGIEKSGRRYIEPHPDGMSLPPDARITCILGNDPTEHALVVQADGKRLYYQALRPATLHTFIAEVGGERWILGDTRNHAPAEE
jgi:hypothetical protein